MKLQINKNYEHTNIDGIMSCTMTGRWNKRQVTNNSLKINNLFK